MILGPLRGWEAMLVAVSALHAIVIRQTNYTLNQLFDQSTINPWRQHKGIFRISTSCGAKNVCLAFPFSRRKFESVYTKICPKFSPIFVLCNIAQKLPFFTLIYFFSNKNWLKINYSISSFFVVAFLGLVKLFLFLFFFFRNTASFKAPWASTFSFNT